MVKPDKVIVGLGELLWDEFPEYSKPGGAPANFTFNVNQLGATGFCVTSVGDDTKGKELIQYLNKAGLDTTFVQINENYPTGRVSIEFEGTEPVYSIHENVAWDHIEWNKKLQRLAIRADAVCFSTLSQRSKESRKTIMEFLEHVSVDCIKVLDLNLRPPFVSEEIILNSLHKADVLKLNETEAEELRKILRTRDLEHTLFNQFCIDKLCITLGEKGSKFVTKDGSVTHEGFKVDTSQGDVVGVGDAFIACITYHLVYNTPLEEALEKANRYAGYMVAQTGAMNTLSLESLIKVLV